MSSEDNQDAQQQQQQQQHQLTKPTLSRKTAPTWAERAALLEGEQHLIVDLPAPNVSRITLNRPECHNLMTHRTRAQLFNQLQLNDQDPDVRVTIICGAGGNFSAGHDFDTFRDEPLPFFEPEGEGQTARNVLNGWFMINDLGKPVIAQVEGEALGGGMELAAACDVCIVSEDATIGYPPVRGQGLPDYQIYPWLCGLRNAMEIMLLNRPMTGLEAMQKGFATECVPKAVVEERTIEFAKRVAKIPADLLQYNKRSVHRAFEAQGIRTNLRTAVDLESLMFKAPGAKMITARRGPAARKVPGAPPPRPNTTPSLPRPVAKPSGAAVGASAVSSNASTTTSTNNTPQKSVPTPQAKAVATPTPPTKSAPPVSAPRKVVGPVGGAATPSTANKSATPMKSTAATAATSTKPTTTPATANKPAAPLASKSIPATPQKSATTATPSKPPLSSTITTTTKPASTIPASMKKKDDVVVESNNEDSVPTTTTTKAGEVHLHLHDAIHIHIGGSKL
jgi:enoyl-CoA hydratase